MLYTYTINKCIIKPYCFDVNKIARKRCSNGFRDDLGGDIFLNDGYIYVHCYYNNINITLQYGVMCPSLFSN